MKMNNPKHNPLIRRGRDQLPQKKLGRELRKITGPTGISHWVESGDLVSSDVRSQQHGANGNRSKYNPVVEDAKHGRALDKKQ